MKALDFLQQETQQTAEDFLTRTVESIAPVKAIDFLDEVSQEPQKPTGGYTGSWGTPGYTGEWTPSREPFKKEVKEAGYLPTAGKSFISGIGDVYTGVADALDWTGLEGYSEPYRSFGKRLQTAYEIPVDPAEFTFDKILDPAWLATNAIRAVPFTLSLIPAALVGAYGGGSAAGMVGLGAFGKVVLGSIGAASLSRPIESALEAGGTYQKVLNETGDAEKAKAAGNNTFKLNMALTGLDAAEFATAFVPLKVGGAKGLLKRVLATSGKLAAVGAMEAGEEWYQDVAQEVSTDVSWENIKEEITKMPPERKEAVSIGGLFGIGLGGTGSVYSALSERVTTNMPKKVKETYDKALKETKTDIEALDKVAETPEGKSHIENVVKELKEGKALTSEELIAERAKILEEAPRKPAEVAAEVFEKELPTKKPKPEMPTPTEPTAEVAREPVGVENLNPDLAKKVKYEGIQTKAVKSPTGELTEKPAFHTFTDKKTHSTFIVPFEKDINASVSEHLKELEQKTEMAKKEVAVEKVEKAKVKEPWEMMKNELSRVPEKYGFKIMQKTITDFLPELKDSKIVEGKQRVFVVEGNKAPKTSIDESGNIVINFDTLKEGTDIVDIVLKDKATDGIRFKYALLHEIDHKIDLIRKRPLPTEGELHVSKLADNYLTAIKEGKPFLPEVLAEYPDLKSAKPTAPKLPEAKPPEAVREKIKGEVIPEEVKPKVEKETIPVDEAISLQKERINKANAIDKVFERMSLKSLIEFKELGKKEVPIKFFTEKEKEHKAWKPGMKIPGIEKKAKVEKEKVEVTPEKKEPFNIVQATKKILPDGSDVHLDGEQLSIYPSAIVNTKTIIAGAYKLLSDRQLQDSVKTIKVFNPEAEPVKTEPVKTKKIKVKPIEQLGKIWIKNIQKPIMSAREITKGKNKGKYEVVLTKGRDAEGNIKAGLKRVVAKDDIVGMPVEKPTGVEAPEGKVFATKGTLTGTHKILNVEGEDVGSITLSREGDIVNIDDIEVLSKGRGTGTKTIQDLMRTADKEGLTITLSSDAMRGKESQRLNRLWYKKLGFIRNVGKDKIKGISEEFYYRPKLFATAIKPKDTITRADLKSIFAKMKNISTGVDKAGNFFFRPFGKPVVTIYTVNEIEGYIDTSKGQIPVGSFLGNTIELKTGGEGHTADIGTAFHEFEHWMEANNILSGNDIKALNAVIAKSEGISESKVTEEHRATYVGDRLSEWQGQKNLRIRRVLKKIADFVNSIWELVMRTRTARGVLADIETGKILSEKELSAVNQFAQDVSFSLKKAAKAITDNPNFVKWFKDSKILNDKNEPLVVYHGTADPITIFSEGERGRTTTAESAKKGFFFASNKEVAKGYAEFARPKKIDYLKSEYERLEKIAQRIGTSKAWDAHDKAYAKYENAEFAYIRDKRKTKENVVEAYLSIKNPLVHDYEGKEFRDESYSELIDEAILNKNDGVVFKNTYDGTSEPGTRTNPLMDVYVAFDSTQIKSIYNTGAFGITEPDIMFAMAGEKAIGAPTGQLIKAQEMERDINALTVKEDMYHELRGETGPFHKIWRLIDENTGKKISNKQFSSKEAAERALEKEKKDRKKEVWRETGWMRGVEGKWKFEIDDSGAKLKNIKIDSLGIAEKNIVDLKDILHHPELFKNYPELSNLSTTIMIDKEMGNPRGVYSPATTALATQIKIYAKNLSDTKDYLLHEIQHAIQEIEGFARGGRPEQFTVKHGILKPATRGQVAIFFGLEPSGKVYLKEGGAITKDKLSLVSPQEQLFFKETPGSQYQRLAGEIEARDTAERAKLTPAQRGQNFNKAKRLFEQTQKIRQSDKYKAEEKTWLASDMTDADLKSRNESSAHKKLYAIEDEIMGMGYNLNQRLVREALAGDKSAQDSLIQMPYESQGIPQDQWIITEGEGTSFSVEESKMFATKPTVDYKEMLKRYKGEAKDEIEILEEEIQVLRKQFKQDIKVTPIRETVIEATGKLRLSDIIKEARVITRETYEAIAKRKKGIALLKLKERYQTSLIKARARKEASARVNKIIKGLKKIDTEKMSPPQAKAINNILRDIDLTKLSSKKQLSLEKTRQYLDGNPDAEMPSYVLKDLERLSKKPIRDLTLDEFESLNIAVLHHAHLDKVKQTIRVGREMRRSKQTLDDSLMEMKPAKKIKDNIVSSQTGKMGKLKRTGRLIADTFGIRHDHFDLIIESLAGQNSIMDKVLYQGVKEGITEELKYKQNTFKKFQDDVGDFGKKYKIKDITKWLSETIKTGKFELTRGERTALYRHSLNPDNKRAIIEGGFGFKFSESPNKVHRITKDEFNSIIDSLTNAEKDFAGKSLDNLFADQIERLDKIFLEKNGYALPREKNYYPKDTMPLARALDIETEDALELFKGKWLRVGVSKGMLEKRKRVALPIYLNSITHDINKSVAKSAAYIGLEIPLSNASKLLYNPTFRLNLSNKYGEQTWKEIEKGLRDIAGEYQTYTTTEKLLIKAKNRLSVAMLGVNPFVMAKQVLSLPVYLPYVKSRYLTMGIIDSIWNPGQVITRHKLYSPELLERIEGGYSRDVADVFKAGAEKRIYAGQKSIKEKFMGGIKLFDKMAVMAGMQGSVLQTLDDFKAGKLSREVRIALDMKDSDIAGLSSEQKMKLAYKFADYATQRTQPMFSPEHRSSLSRGSTVEKLATMFGSFTNQALNLTRRSYREAIRTGDKEAYAKFAKSLMVIFVINTMGVMAIDDIRDRLYSRDERPFWGRILSSWAAYMFFVRDLASSVVSKIERGTFLGYDVSLPISRIPELLSNSIANGVTTLTEKNIKKRKKAAINFIDDSLELSLMLYGIPYATPKRLGERIIFGGKKTKKSRQQMMIEHQRR